MRASVVTGGRPSLAASALRRRYGIPANRRMRVKRQLLPEAGDGQDRG
jgi:hypothetical protein